MSGGGVHLFVLIHGFMGNPDHMENARIVLEESVPSGQQCRFLVTKTHSLDMSMDGIDICGERVLVEVQAELEDAKKQNKPVTKISIVGYSMGGLVGRYLIGRLHQLGLLDTIEPMNYVTIATPHLGIRRPTSSVINRVFNWASARFVSHSGAQMALDDAFYEDLPLLVYMVEPESIFYKGLARFKNRVAYANVVNDRTVPYSTAAISASNPYRKEPFLGEYEPKYPLVIKKSNATELDGQPKDFLLGSLSPSSSMADEADGPMRIVAAIGGEEAVTAVLGKTESVTDLESQQAGRTAATPNERSVLLSPETLSQEEAALQRRTYYQYVFLSLLLVPGLVIIPIVAIVAVTFGSISRVRVHFNGRRQLAQEAVLPTSSGSSSLAQKAASSADDSREAWHRENRIKILRNLNRLHWHRVDVRIVDAFNSHGIIIARRNGFYKLFGTKMGPLKHLAQVAIEY